MPQTQDKPQRCRRCILPDNYPGLELDAEGICDFCRKVEIESPPWKEQLQNRSAELKKILEEICSGSFAKEWMEEVATGRKNFNALYQADHDSTVEEVGRRLRKMMAWIDDKEV